MLSFLSGYHLYNGSCLVWWCISPVYLLMKTGRKASRICSLEDVRE